MASLTKDSPTVRRLNLSPSYANQAEDEAWKKHTDCVFFLASPLTCKKGSECEYRHSESARLNSRECWYWRNSPRDGLVGAPVAVTGKSSLPSTKGVSSTTYCSTKQGVPCIFFQKGYCLKGDRCPFLHGSILAINKVPQVPAAGATGNYTQQKIVPPANVAKLVEALPEAKATAMSATTLPRDGACTKTYGPPSTASIDEPPNNKETIAASINHEFPKCKSRPYHHASSLDDQSFQGNYDADNLLGESSLGFDVLVDDEIGDADYYHDGYQLVRMRGYDGRNQNELEIVDDYTVVADDDPETHHNSRGYDSDEHMQKQLWGSPDRSLREAAHFDRRGSIEESDLRQHLLKQRRVNGLRSVINPDFAPKGHTKKRSYQNGQRDSYHSPPHESSLCIRLQDRIRLPRKSQVYDDNLHLERENDLGRNRERLPSSRPQYPSHMGRIPDRLKGRIQGDLNEGKCSRGPRMKRNDEDDNVTDFTGPKSLMELNVTKQYCNDQKTKHEQSYQQKWGYPMLDNSHLAEDDLLFEGRKPLREILKRKREAAASMGAMIFSSKEDKQQFEIKDNLTSNSSSSAMFFEK